MSQRSVERAMGKLVTDEGFRLAFFADPERAARRAGIDLSSEELDALRHVPRQALDELCARLDGRICRIQVSSEAE